MLIIGICDDDAFFRSELRNLIEKRMDRGEVKYKFREYTSGEELMSKECLPDFLFLDIEMEGMSGIEVKDEIESFQNVKIVFVTNHGESVRQAFGRNVYGFLDKPIDEDYLTIYLDRMLVDLEDERIYLFKGREKKFAVQMKHILYICSERKYCNIITTNEEIFCTESMKTLVGYLPEDSFFRCHKSYLIHLRHIQTFRNPLVMTDGNKIPVSRGKYKELKERYFEYVYKKAR